MNADAVPGSGAGCRTGAGACRRALEPAHVAATAPAALVERRASARSGEPASVACRAPAVT